MTCKIFTKESWDLYNIGKGELVELKDIPRFKTNAVIVCQNDSGEITERRVVIESR